MPLNPQKLAKDIEVISASGGADWNAICDAIADYAFQGQFPPPIGVKKGLDAIKPLLNSITPGMGPKAPKILSNAFMILGAFIMMGMPIGTGLGPTKMPPSGPNFDAVFKGPQEAKQFSQNLAREIDTWMRKGKFDVGFIGGSGPVVIYVPWM